MKNIEKYPDCKNARDAFDIFKAEGGKIDFYEWLNLPYVEPKKPTTAYVLAKALIYIDNLPKDNDSDGKKLVDELSEVIGNEAKRGRMNFMRYDNPTDACFAFNNLCAQLSCKQCRFYCDCRKTARAGAMARWLYSDMKTLRA